MGLFGSSSKTYYNSTSTLLFEEMPSIVKQTVVSSTVQNRNIASDLIANLVNGIGFNAKRLYNYAKAGTYPYGLPEGSKTLLAPNHIAYVTAIIEHEIGSSISLEYLVLDVDPATSHLIYRAQYYVKDNNGKLVGTVQTWEYDESTGTYPLLDVDEEDTQSVSPYFPIIPVRINNQSTVASGQPYRTQIIQAGRFLGLEIEDLADSIQEQTADTGDNPVEDAYVILGVDVSNQTQEGIEYLFRYFNYMLPLDTVTKQDYEYWLANQEEVAVPPMNSVRIEDANYKMELGWLYINSTLVTGTLTDRYTSHHVLEGEFLLPDGETTYTRDTLVLRKRVSDTQYQELSIVGLVHSNWAVGKELRTTLTSAFEDPDGLSQSFIIPLRQDITNRMLTTDVHDLMYSSIRLVLNDVLKVKLKWYQTGFFQFFVMVVAIVVSIYYPPLGVAALSAAAVGIAVAQAILVKVLAPIVYKELENLVGEELAILVAVIAIAYGANFNLSTGVGFSGVTTTSALQAGLYGVNAYNQLRTRDALLSIQNELAGLEEEIDALEQSAQERQEDVLLVSKSIAGDPYAIMQPEHYIRRFQYATREPLLILNTTESFVDMARFTDRPNSYIYLGQTGA